MNQLSLYETNNKTTPIFDNRKLDLLKNTICKGATDDEFELFLHACQRTGLDPFMKQIHAVPRWDSTLRRNTITIQTGIDGYRLIAERTGKYSPGKEPTYKYDEQGNIVSCTAYIKKQTYDGTWHEVASTAFFSEYCQKTKEGKPTKFWIQLGHVMIAKCAEALALRKAFPGDLSGIYTKEEMLQSEVVETTAEYSKNNIDDVRKMVVEIPKTNNKLVEIQTLPNSKQVLDNNEDKLEMINTITKDQWDALKILISQCSDKFQENVWSGLETNDVNDDTYPDMGKHLYMKITLACQGHLMKKKKEENEKKS